MPFSERLQPGLGDTITTYAKESSGLINAASVNSLHIVGRESNKRTEHGLEIATPTGNWFIVPPQEKIPATDTYYYLNGAREVLRGRQILPKKFASKEEELHEENLYFMEEYWDTLYPFLFNDSKKRNPRKVIGPKDRYLEVTLNDYMIELEDNEKRKNRPCGTADFIGVGPHGQLVIIEFGKSISKKNGQVARHAAGLGELLRNVNHGVVPPIIPLIGVYSDSADGRTIRIMHALEEEVERQRKAPVKQTEIFNAKKHAAGLASS